MVDLVQQVPALEGAYVIRQGADAKVALEIIDANSNPQDLTGYTMKSEIREQTAGATERGSTPYPWTVDWSGAATGVFVLTIAGADTANIPVNLYRWDALLYGPAPGNEIVHLLASSARVVPGVTDPTPPPAA